MIDYKQAELDLKQRAAYSYAMGRIGRITFMYIHDLIDRHWGVE